MIRTENGNRRIDFDEYRYMEQDGEFEGRFVWRWKNPRGDLECFFDLDDGRKIRATTWADREYLHMDTFPVGDRCRLEFRRSGSGRRSYLRRVLSRQQEQAAPDPFEECP
jgi:hypothetical protein